MAAPTPCPARTRRPPRGTVYLLHFDSRYVHAGHYIGFTTDLEARLVEHQTGRGARLMEVVVNAGRSFVLARTWPNTDRMFERKLHRRKASPRLCPLCSAQLRLPL